METREFVIRSMDLETRTVTGIAVPWNQVIEVGGYRESFQRGSITGYDDTLLRFEHRDTIGKVVKGEDTDEGYVVTAQISDTTQGRDAYTLLKDGVIKKFSVGFQPVENRDEDGVVVRTKVNFKEVSLVSFPAYAGASVSEVRSAEDTKNNNSEESTMSNDITNEVADVREAVTDLERRFATMNTNTSKPTINRSAAEVLKGLAANDSTIKDELRAFTGSTTVDADVHTPAFYNIPIRLVDEQRPTINFFDRAALPSSGNTIEYPLLSSTTGTVTAQGGEGVDLTFMEVVLTHASTNVVTYGGYSSLSRQAIERSDTSFLQATLEFQARQYAKATETAVRTAVAGATGTNTLTAGGTTPTAVQWQLVVANAAGLIEDNSNGDRATAMFVSRDVFLKLAALVDTTGRPMFVINGDGSNTIGNISLVGIGANVAGLQVIVNKDLSTGTAFVAGRSAVTTFESAGAPFRLNDENIINLTKEFSLFGYLAVAVKNPKALVKVTLSA